MRIPLRIASTAVQPTASNRRGLTIPLTLFGSSGSGHVAQASTASAVTANTVAIPNSDELVRASVAAAALTDPADGVKLAELAENNPEKTVLPKIDDSKILPVLSAIQSVQLDPGSGPSATAEQIEVAQIVGVRPELVAAAAAEINAPGNAAQINERSAALRKYTAALQPEMLRAAATTGARSQLFAVVPTRQGRLERIETEISDLRACVEAIGEKIDKLAASSRAQRSAKAATSSSTSS